jgi:uncharacterized lipoprotein NlpE involved in copper resistance
MKKSKLVAVSLIGVLLAVGLALAGCDEKNNCSGDGSCYADYSREYGTDTGDWVAAGRYCGTDTAGCAVLKAPNVSGDQPKPKSVKCDC